MATLLMRPADGGSADRKRRARKCKNAQKKQPQRGLGVAQLEKLRLQEQSLLCPTAPSYSFRLSATDSDHPMVRCDADVSQTVLSLTTSNVHPQVGGGGCSSSGVVRGGEAGTLSRLSALNGHSTTQSCLSPHLAHDLNKGNGEAFHAAAKRAVASRALACLNQSSKFPSVNASFFSNALTATQLQILESQAQAQQKVEEHRAVAAGESSGNAAAYIFPSITSYLKEASGNHVADEAFKLHPLFKDYVGSPTTSGRTDSTKELSSFQTYPSLQAKPAAVKISGRKRPWLVLQENSWQGCHGQALDLNAPVEESDAGDDEPSPVQPNQVPEFRVGAHYTTGIVRNALGNSSLPIGAKVKLCSSSSGAHWLENSESPSHVTAYFPEIGLYSDTAIGFRQCPSQSSIKDSCSSATGSSSYLSRNRQTSLKDPDIPPSLVEKESICSDFLTLGISSSSYTDRNGWNESEESIQDNTTPTSMNDVSRFRQQRESTTTGCEGDNHAFQVRKSVICTQEVGGFDLKGDPSRSLSLDYDGGGTQGKSTMLLRDFHLAPSSHYSEKFPSLPPPSKANSSLGHAEESNIDYGPSSKSSTQNVGDILDLRLKLAL